MTERLTRLSPSCLVALGVALLTACGGSAEDSAPSSGGIANVRLVIGAGTGASTGAPPGFAFSGVGAGGDRTGSASFADTARITVDITDVSVVPARVVYRDIGLFLQQDGLWSTTLPFLPAGVQLQFAAHAYDTAGFELFSGTTVQVLSTGSSVVTIGLNTYDNGRILPVPRITRISVPAEFACAASDSIVVAVEASAGEAIRFAVTPDARGGEFFPRSGQVTLAGTTGSLVFQFQAPILTANTSLTHTVEISNARGTTVRSTFSTMALRCGAPGTSDTTLRVQFPPVINAFIAQRVGLTSDVLLTADVTDDNPTNPDLLAYAWSFTPTPGQTYSPAPAFTAAARTTTFTNYAPAVSGTIRLQVTDGDGGTTTLHFTLAPQQFPDDVLGSPPAGGLVAVAAGGAHTCALFSSSDATNKGAVRCWGSNAGGQLGYGNTYDVGVEPDVLPAVAGSIPGLGSATQIATGFEHTCALFSSGQVACWGRNDYGQLGYGHTQPLGDNEAVASYGYVNVGANVVRIATGGYHTCALLDTGKVRCWGRNDFGQLGYGNTNTVGDDESPYTAGDVALSGARVKDITAGQAHTCALFQDGKARCWGYNAYGQLGYGNTINVGDNELPLATNISTGGTVMQLAAGAHHTCALLTTGSLRCWGRNADGQLGYPALWSSATTYDNWGDAAGETPAVIGDVAVGTGRAALQVVAGSNFTCAILDTGSVRCWGFNGSGELGQGNGSRLTSPPVGGVSLGASAVRLSAGADHACALLATGGARCWGFNGYGQLGYGHRAPIGDDEPVDAVSPVLILGGLPRGVAALAAGGNHTCARLMGSDAASAGTLRCWGRNDYGQLGYGNTNAIGDNELPYTASVIPGLQGTTQVAAGGNHNCALFGGGKVACWGYNNYGQLGYSHNSNLGDNEAVAASGYVNLGGNAVRIAAGANHTCALLDTGNVRCWGSAGSGQLGYGNTNNIGDNEHPYTAGDVPLGGARVKNITTGDSHTCVLLEGGSVRCWGRNSEGQLGYGNTTQIGDNEPPLTSNVDIGGTVTQIAAGSNHTCALLSTGAVRCWGYNNSGQLGYPNLWTDSSTYNNWGDIVGETPATIGNVNLGAGRTALEIATGANHTCALLDTGKVRCWGAAGSGQLGYGNTTLLSAPPAADVPLGASTARLAAGSNHTCALLVTGAVRCWGYNAYGQLGYGSTNTTGDNEQVDTVGPVQVLSP